MCGRTALTAAPDDLRAAFGLERTPDVVPHYNVTPSQPVAVVRVLRGSSSRTLEPLRWGLVPSWADDPKVGNKLALARVETVATTPAFRDAFRARRCLVVVDAFYEWRRDGKGPSQPFVVRGPGGAPFALAGVWDRWTSRDGEVIESCAILTQAALPPLDAVHDRMPIVLPSEAWTPWLDPATADVAPLLATGTMDLRATAVSPWVNDPRHDDARCTEPYEPPQGSLF